MGPGPRGTRELGSGGRAGRFAQQTPPLSNPLCLRLAHRPRPRHPAAPRCGKETALTGPGPSTGAPFSPLAPGTVLGLPSAPLEHWGSPEPGRFQESTLQSLLRSEPSS